MNRSRMDCHAAARDARALKVFHTGYWCLGRKNDVKERSLYSLMATGRNEL